MDKYELQQSLVNNRINDLNVRVVYYARVSTDSTDQLNSLKNQQTYYENYIKSNPNWIYCGGYIDEGLSGVNTKNRDKFNEMIEDAKNDKFDYIITKEISRFARNTLDSISYTRKLLEYGVGVWFQEDNINTADPEAELRLTIMSGMAQDESRRISRRVKFGHRQAIKNGSVLGNSRMYGYRHNKGKLVVDESEAEMVRLIFNLYATGDVGLRKIEDDLFLRGYRNRKGGRIDRNVISNIIQNPKYKGYYCGNKVEVIDLFTKQQRFKNEEDWILWKDEDGTTVPSIVDEGIWNKANEIFKIKSTAVKLNRGNETHRNLFTSKIICTEHDCSYHLKSRQVHGIIDNRWGCKVKLREGASKCKSFAIKESELITIVDKVFREYKLENNKLVDSFMEYYDKTHSNKNIETEIKNINEQNKEIQDKKDKLLELMLKSLISEKEFKTRNDQFNSQFEENEDKLNNLKLTLNTNDRTEQLERIRIISKKILDDKIMLNNKEVIDTIVDKIYATPIDNNTMNLKIVLNTGMTKSVNYNKNGTYTDDEMFSLDNIFLTIFTKENMKVIRRGYYSSPNFYNYNIEICI